MAETARDDGEKAVHVPIQPEGAAQDLSAQEPGQHLAYDHELSSELEKQYDLGLARTVTQTTVASVSTFPPDIQPDSSTEKKPWYKKLNPLKRGKAIPVPVDRKVSNEYGANLFSLLTFQWMAPLMKVPPRLRFLGLIRRRGLVELTGKLGWLPTTVGAQ